MTWRVLSISPCAEDAAYANITESLASAIGTERHRMLRQVVKASPGNSVATLRIPPLPDDAMDALINAMGTPEVGGGKACLPPHGVPVLATPFTT